MTTESNGDDKSLGGLKKGQLYQETANIIRAKILTGELAPGERLREVKLCEQLGVSRTPVREAFRTLAAEGLIDLLPNRSVVVSKLDASDLIHLFEVFGELEGLGAKLACDHITNDELTEIGRYLADMVDCHSNGERSHYMELNQKIHRRTIEISGNPVLKTVWLSLVPRIERARAIPNLDAGRWTQALFEHSKMFTALAARDGELLASLTKKHFLNSLPYIAADVEKSSEKG